MAATALLPAVTSSRRGRIPWTTLRGINEVRPLANSVVTSSNMNMIRCRPNVTWARVGTSLRYTPTIDFAAFETRINAWPSRVRVVIDPHTFPGLPDGSTTHADNPFYWHLDFQLNAAEYWRQVGAWAAAKGSRIAGFDILNEPDPPSRSNASVFPQVVASSTDIAAYNSTMASLIPAWSTLGWVAPTSTPALAIGDQDPRSWRGIVNRCAAAIRESNRKHPIIVEQWYTGGTNSAAGEGTSVNCGGGRGPNHNPSAWFVPDDPYWVQSFHIYEPSSYCSAGTGTRPTASEITTYLADMRAWELTLPGVPIYIGEFGAVTAASELALWASDMIDQIEAFGWSWGYHTYANNRGTFDASVNPDLLNRLLAAWALNP